MENVMTDVDLLRIIFNAIEDPLPTVAARALTNVRAVNHVVRNATAVDERHKYHLLLYNHYDALLAFNNRKLAMAISADKQHPITYVKGLHRFCLQKENRKQLSLRSHFVHDLEVQHCLVEGGLPSRMRGLPLSKWVHLQWHALEPWKEAAYMACHPTEPEHPFVKTVQSSRPPSYFFNPHALGGH